VIDKTTTKTEVKIKVDAADHSRIVGVQYGLDENEVIEALDKLLDQKLSSLLIQPKGAIPRLDKVKDRVLGALYACESDGSSSLGFAVNNSGILVCANIGGDLQARNIASGCIHKARGLRKGRILQAVGIDAKTTGLLPAYRTPPLFGEPLYAFDAVGRRVAVKMRVSHLSFIMNFPVTEHESGVQQFQLDECFGIETPNEISLLGGPVMNINDEVMGVFVARASGVPLAFVRPWSSIDVCVMMEPDSSTGHNG
jgi:hypothetical protein